MIETQNIEREAYRSLNRILSRVEGRLGSEMEKDHPSWMQFCSRLHRNFSVLFTLPASWMNVPRGLAYFKGEHHLQQRHEK